MVAVKLFEGDMRLATLAEAVKGLLYERGEGLPVPSILGVLDIVKHDIIAENL